MPGDAHFRVADLRGRKTDDGQKYQDQDGGDHHHAVVVIDRTG